MEILLMACVGQRDVQKEGNVPGQWIPLDKGNLREESKQILDNLSEWENRLRFPMIEAALKEIRHNEHMTPVEVILFPTDQQNPNHRKGDTIHCASIIKTLLRKKSEYRVQDVKIVELVRQPNRYDQMWEEMEGKLEKLDVSDFNSDVYVLLAGGTPAQNFGMLMAAFTFFGDRLQALAVDESSAGAVALRVNQKLIRDLNQRKLETILDNWDFSGAQSLLSADSLAALCAKAAVARLHLNTSSSKTHMEELSSLIVGNIPEEVDLLANDLRVLNAGSPAKEGLMVREVYWNAWIKWHRQEYADFLGRLWRLQEAALQKVCSEITGLNLAEKQQSDRKAQEMREWLSDHPKFDEYLTNRRNPLDPAYNTPVYQAILECAVRHCPSDVPLPSYAATLLKAVESLRELRNLRNHSILAHGFEPVTREQIMDLFKPKESDAEQNGDKGQQLLDHMKLLLCPWEIEAGSNPYELFRKLILTLNEQGR